MSIDLMVEVYTNLVRITDGLWEVFGWPGVSLATSYHSDDSAQHAEITRRRGCPARDPGVRAGVIDLGGGQRAGHAQAELVDPGVPAVGYDRVRQVGRVCVISGRVWSTCADAAGTAWLRSPRMVRSGRVCSGDGCRSVTFEMSGWRR